jgi:ABC-2 type transport system ATP-binding protein
VLRPSGSAGRPSGDRHSGPGTTDPRAERPGTGRLVVVETVERLKAKALRHMDLTFRGAPPLTALARTPGWRDASAAGHTVHLAVEGSTSALLEVAAPHHVEQIVTPEPDLEEIFLTYYGEA